MADAIRRVTVRGGGRPLDVALAAAAPVAELLPVLAAEAGEVDGPVLARVGEAPLVASASLDGAGVLDGEVLYLVEAGSWPAPDVADERTAARRSSRRWAGTAAAVALATGPGAALAAVALAAEAAARATGAPATATAVAAVVSSIVGLRVLGPLCGLGLAARTAGLDAARDRWAIAASARRCRTLLASLAAGLAAVLVAATPALLAGGGEPGLALALVAAASLAVRAGSYRYLVDVLPPAAGAAAALLLIEAIVGRRLIAGTTDPVGLAMVVAGGLTLVAASAVWHVLPRPPRAAWLALDLLLAPLALAALGVLDDVARLVQHVAGVRS